VTPDANLARELCAGVVCPWVDGYWQAYDIDMTVGLVTRWTHTTFRSGPGHFFKLNGATGWQPVGGTLPEGAENLGVCEGAWDHEHCEICRGHIGSGGVADGYVDPEEHWLCPSSALKSRLTIRPHLARRERRAAVIRSHALARLDRFSTRGAPGAPPPRTRRS
jgi:hypothetical protein